MKIKLTPQRRNDDIELIKQGDILFINGESFDFSLLVEGARLPFGSVNCEYIIGDVYRVNNEIELTLILPYNTTHSEQRKFPKEILIFKDGIVELPK